jgi:hypothetical protein
LVNGLIISGVTTDTLRFNATTILDTATNYNVIISSTCSLKDTSANVSLNISTPPIIITEPTNQTACAGSSVSFTAVVSGNGITYQWRKGNVNLVNGGNILGVNSATLIINPVSITDIGSNYNLVVTNACNFTDSSTNASLNVFALPIAAEKA